MRCTLDLSGGAPAPPGYGLTVDSSFNHFFIFQVVNLTWVQPRVLDLSQIKEMNKRIKEWADSVEKTVEDVEKQIPELLCN